MKTSFGVPCGRRWRLVILALAGLAAVPMTQAAHIFETIITTGSQFNQIGMGSAYDSAEVSLNSSGTVAFRASKGNTSGIYTFSGGTLVTVTTETTIAGDPVIQRFVQSPVINDAGLLAWLRYASDQGSSVRVGTTGPGAAAAYANASSFYSVANISLGSSNRVMFYGSTGIGAGGIYTWGSGDTEYIRYCYSTGPRGNLAGYLDLIYAPYTASKSGTAIFRASFEMTSSSDTSREGLFTGASAGFETVVTNQTPQFASFSSERAVINDSNQIAFIATLKQPDSTTGATTGIFMRENNQFPLIIPSSGSGFHDFTSLSLANNGTLLFVALEGTQTSGIYLRSPEGTVSRVVGTGDALAGSTVLYANTSATGLNESGQVAFLARLADGRYGVFLAKPALPGTVPVAVNDSFEIRGTTKLSVLVNDTPATGGALKITAVGPAAKGKATISGTMINYTPGKTFDGTDSFSYTVTSNGHSAAAQVTVTNPFTPLQGSFSQLVTADGAAVGTAAVTLTSGGAVSGKLIISGVTYTLRGTAAFDGSFTQTFKRKPAGTPDLVVSLDFEKEGLTRISGTASGDAVTYQIAAGTATLTALPAGVEAGTYTVLLPPDADSSHPRGTGYATAKLAANGKLTFSGKLGDGTAFTAATALNAEKGARLYVPLYVKPKGALSGTVIFATSPSRFGGSLAWVKPAPVKPVGVFASGFSATTQASGSRFVAPAKTARVLTYTSTGASAGAALQMRDGGLAGPLDASLTVTLADKVTVTSPDTYKVKITLNRSTGAMSGSFVPPVGAKAVSFSGILHQGENKGAGFFLGASQSGSVIFTPQ